MKKLLIFAAAAALSVATYAQRVAVVDMDRVYQNHWKTEDFINKLQGARQDLEDKVNSLRAEGQSLVDTFNKQRERLNNPAFDRATAEREAQETAQKIQEKQQEIQILVQRTQAAANERQNQHRITIMDEIRRTVGTIARQRGATLAVDSSGRSVNGAITVLFAADEVNITDEVIREVNKDRPANITPPPTPRTGGATGGGEPPEIRLPGNR
jgi:outer membrane protein